MLIHTTRTNLHLDFSFIYVVEVIPKVYIPKRSKLWLLNCSPYFKACHWV